MSAIRSTENKTDRALRSALHRMGLRFRKNFRKLPGKPDIAFVGARVAVFVDGDFWHARVIRERGWSHASKVVRSSQDYWIPKFERNIARDESVTAELRAMGWLVIRLWESDVEANVSRATRLISKAVRRRTGLEP